MTTTDTEAKDKYVGVLKKRTNSKIFHITQFWQLRILELDGNELKYYKSKKEQEEKSEHARLLLSEINACLQDKEDRRIFALWVTKPVRRSYEFKCDNIDECDKWVNLIKPKIGGLRSITSQTTGKDRIAPLTGMKPILMVPYDGWSVFVRIVKARNLLSKDLRGKSDPYIKLICSYKEEKSDVIPDSLDPEWKWDCQMTFPRAQRKPKSLYIRIIDYDEYKRHDPLGGLIIELDQYFNGYDPGPQWVPITYKDEPAGELLLQIKARCGEEPLSKSEKEKMARLLEHKDFVIMRREVFDGSAVRKGGTPLLSIEKAKTAFVSIFTCFQTNPQDREIVVARVEKLMNSIKPKSPAGFTYNEYSQALSDVFYSVAPQLLREEMSPSEGMTKEAVNVIEDPSLARRLHEVLQDPMFRKLSVHAISNHDSNDDGLMTREEAGNAAIEVYSAIYDDRSKSVVEDEIHKLLVDCPAREDGLFGEDQFYELLRLALIVFDERFKGKPEENGNGNLKVPATPQRVRERRMSILRPSVLLQVQKRLNDPEFKNHTKNIFNASDPDKDGKLTAAQTKIVFLHLFSQFYSEPQHKKHIDIEVDEIIKVAKTKEKGFFTFDEYHDALTAIFYAFGPKKLFNLTEPTTKSNVRARKMSILSPSQILNVRKLIQDPEFPKICQEIWRLADKKNTGSLSVQQIREVFIHIVVAFYKDKSHYSLIVKEVDEMMSLLKSEGKKEFNYEEYLDTVHTIFFGICAALSHQKKDELDGSLNLGALNEDEEYNDTTDIDNISLIKQMVSQPSFEKSCNDVFLAADGDNLGYLNEQQARDCCYKVCKHWIQAKDPNLTENDPRLSKLSSTIDSTLSSFSCQVKDRFSQVECYKFISSVFLNVHEMVDMNIAPGTMKFDQHLKVTKYKILVTVLSGSELIVKDRTGSGKSDPYCVVKIGDQEEKTRIFQKTLNPKWDKTFEFVFPKDKKPESVKFTVWDWDQSFNHDFMGEAELKLDEFYISLKSTPKNLRLQKVKTGYLRLVIHCQEITKRILKTDPKQDKIGLQSLKQKLLAPSPKKKGLKGAIPVLPFGNIVSKQESTTVSSAMSNLHKQDVDSSISQAGIASAIASDKLEPRTTLMSPRISTLADNFDDKVKGKQLDKIPPPKPKITSPPVTTSTTEVIEKNKEEEIGKYDTGTIGKYDATTTMMIPQHVVTIQCKCARNLIKGDDLGLSDPYLMVKIGDQKQKTEIKNKTLSPEWNEEKVFVAEGNARPTTIQFECWDWDIGFSKETSLGQASLDLSPFWAKNDFHEAVLPLQKVKRGEIVVAVKAESRMLPKKVDKETKKKGFFGRLKGLIPGKKGDSDTLKRSAEAAMTSVQELMKSGPCYSVHVDVRGANDLIKADIEGWSDPYCTLQVLEQKHKTSIVKNSANPEWHQDFDFVVPSTHFPTSITFKVFDWDEDGSSDDLGQVSVSLLPYLDSMPADETLTLEGVASGHIRVKITVNSPKEQALSSVESTMSQCLCVDKDEVPFYEYLDYAFSMNDDSDKVKKSKASLIPLPPAERPYFGLFDGFLASLFTWATLGPIIGVPTFACIAFFSANRIRNELRRRAEHEAEQTAEEAPDIGPPKKNEGLHEWQMIHHSDIN